MALRKSVGWSAASVAALGVLLVCFALLGSPAAREPGGSSGGSEGPHGAVLASSAGSASGQEADGSGILWRLGRADDSDGEFGDYGAAKPSVTIAEGAGTDWKQVPRGLDKSVHPEFAVRYRLETVPLNGVTLRVRILDAYKTIPQMAVFSNRLLAGIVQIAGVEGTGSSYSYRKTYELYIPKEMLAAGDNELKLQAIECLYCSAAEDAYLRWSWDDIELERLDSPAKEPIHGRYVASGTNVNNMSFYYDEGAVRHLPYVLKWLGIAYSGNIMRTGCATDVKNACSSIGKYYETLRDYNTQAVSFHLHTGSVKLKPDGSLSEDAAGKLSDYLKNYGSLFQYYEIDNEPGLFNRSKQVNLAVAEWLNANIPKLAPHLKTVAPGWAYQPAYSVKPCRNQTGSGAGRCGDPDGWEADPAQRKELEDLTDYTNGHSYGSSYADGVGGSFPENLRTFGGAEDGLPKPMLNTEYGTSDSHADSRLYGASEPQAAAFDRIMRAQIGFEDAFAQHAAFYEGFSLFEPGYDLLKRNPAETKIHPFARDGQDSRVDVMRRLNLAYATHGRPLAYRYANADDLKDKLVYFRAVDTSSLAPLAGSGGKSNKILLNFVNFGRETETVRVSVTMPGIGFYEGERFGPGGTYEEARSLIGPLSASPTLTVEETLGPGEAVQYILSRSADVRLKAPSWLALEQLPGRAVRVDWTEAEGAKSYDVLRTAVPGGVYSVVAADVVSTHYVDRTAELGKEYEYRVKANGPAAVTGLLSPPGRLVVSDSVALDRSGWTMTAGAGKPEGAVDANPHSRWDSGADQVPGQWIEADFGGVRRIDRIVLDTSDSPYDYPRRYEVYLSADGGSWSGPVAEGTGGVLTDIRFAAREARAVRIVQTGSGGNYWSVHDLRVYGQAVP